MNSIVITDLKGKTREQIIQDYAKLGFRVIFETGRSK